MRADRERNGIEMGRSVVHGEDAEADAGARREEGVEGRTGGVEMAGGKMGIGEEEMREVKFTTWEGGWFVVEGRAGRWELKKKKRGVTGFGRAELLA